MSSKNIKKNDNIVQGNMKVEFGEVDIVGESPALKKEVGHESEMKKWMVDYVGSKLEPEDESVTVEMIVETMADEFPEFLMAIAEENWIRGYHQALQDVTIGQDLAEAQETDQNEENIE